MDLEEVIQQIQSIEQSWVEKARQHTEQLAIPPRALGRLHDIAERLCGIFGTLEPDVSSKAFLVMAGDHGVVADRVSAFSQEVTGERWSSDLTSASSRKARAFSLGWEMMLWISTLVSTRYFMSSF